jgi:hypothetical protein
MAYTSILRPLVFKDIKSQNEVYNSGIITEEENRSVKVLFFFS